MLTFFLNVKNHMNQHSSLREPLIVILFKKLLKVKIHAFLLATFF